MLLFVGREPTAINERDGMAQRVRWIDDRFSDTPRTILSIAFRRHLRRRRIVRSSTLIVEEVNAFFHLFHIWLMVWRSEATYVHSCYNALCVLPAYFFGKRIVTDMHGATPEEEQLQGNIWRSRILGVVERIVLTRSTALIFVTNAMKQHFYAKYSLSDTTITFIVPILTEDSPCAHSSQREPDLVIYAGGLQAWQQIDQMLDVAEEMAGVYRFLFLTGTSEVLRRKVDSRGLHVEVESAPRSAVMEHYRRASYGFLLRQDSVISRVACPTKLVEYLREGVVPILEQPIIGDFAAMGYRYVLVRNFLQNVVPTPSELEKWREQNEKVVNVLERATFREFESLKQSLIRWDQSN